MLYWAQETVPKASDFASSGSSGYSGVTCSGVNATDIVDRFAALAAIRHASERRSQ
jgi:hypothetical protein